MTARRNQSQARGVLERRPTRYGVLAALRIALGLYWLYEQHWKLPPDFGLHDPRGLMFSFRQGIEYPTVKVYRSFLQNVVVPHFHLFGWLLGFTEVTIGTSLVLGALTRAGALLSVLQSANLLIAQGGTPEGPWIYVDLLAGSLVVLLAPTNRRFSIDSRLAPRVAATRSRASLLTRVWLLAMS